MIALTILDYSPRGKESYSEYVERSVRRVSDHRRLPLTHLDLLVTGKVYVLGIDDGDASVAAYVLEQKTTLIRSQKPSVILTELETIGAVLDRFRSLPTTVGGLMLRTWIAILQGATIHVALQNPQAPVDWPFNPKVVDLAEKLMDETW